MCDNTVQTVPIIVKEDIQKLIQNFAKNTYHAGETNEISSEAMQFCIQLMKVDYNVLLVNNAGGELSTNYPSHLIVLEYECDNNSCNSNNLPPNSSQRATNTIYENRHDPQKLRDQINNARLARCHARFPMPVILYKGKYICRSATLSGGPELYGRTGMEYCFNSTDSNNTQSNPETEFDWHLYNQMRRQDIKLLKSLNVGTIVDFMLENKKVKYGFNISSSEKIDKENRYKDFTIISLPYPGCEFFKEFREHNYVAENLMFDWSQSHIDANLNVPNESCIRQLPIQWEDYKEWDLSKITLNYMRLIIKYLKDGNTGILIHCISGWDRTPLFTSLLRLSMWADGVIHQGLDAHQILYLTIAYDWMLFGHHLSDRLANGEDIFFFCFYMLKYLVTNDFSILGTATKHKNSKLNERNADKHAISTDSSNIDKSLINIDNESQLENVLFEPDSNGSNISNSSPSSSISTISQDHLDEATNGNTSCSSEVSSTLGSTPTTRRTSPVTVPTTRSASRQRNDSESSTGGSYHLVTITGSLKNDSILTNLNREDGSCSQDSSYTLDADGCTLRKDRLLAVRNLFYCYCSTVGFKFKNETDWSFSAVIGNIAEKVGLSQRTPV